MLWPFSDFLLILTCTHLGVLWLWFFVLVFGFFFFPKSLTWEGEERIVVPPNSSSDYS